MKTNMEHFTATNPNPVLSVTKDGTVLYSNEAGEPLLHEWSVVVGDKLPSSIVDIVQRVLSLNIPEKMEVKAGNSTYLITLHPSPEQECVKIYGFDISDLKEVEEKYSNTVEKSIKYQELLDENRALNDEIQSLRARLEEPEELHCSIRKGNIDGLLMPALEEDLMIFTLNSANQTYRMLIEIANEDMLLVDAEFKITSVGKRLLNKTGYNQEEVIGRPWLDFVDDESKAVAKQGIEQVLLGSNESYELKLISKNSSPYWILISAKPFFNTCGKFKGILGMLTDITKRKRVEQEREMTVEFLCIVNNCKGLADLVHSSVRFFREHSGFEAVGVRLKDGDDYPYFEASGFPEEFIRLENSLYIWNTYGQPYRGKNGYPIYECMCGNVINGRFDPTKPFFTARGSFCTNSTTELLASTTEADRQARTRNRCNGEGYESVALIALRWVRNVWVFFN